MDEEADTTTTIKPSVGAHQAAHNCNKIRGGTALPLPPPITPSAAKEEAPSSTSSHTSMARTPGKGIQERLAQLQISSAAIGSHPVLPSNSIPKRLVATQDIIEVSI